MAWKQSGKGRTLREVACTNLGILNVSEITEWEKKSFRNEFHIDGVEQACEIIRRYKDRKIRICGDYDVDGRCASVILFLALRRIGCSKTEIRIPRRFSEGYGLNDAMIDEVNEDDALIITVDSGITGGDVTSMAKRRGMSVIVTDHHPAVKDVSGNAMLPEADILIDPNAVEGSATFNGYCGAGIAYKIASVLLAGDPFLKALLPYAAVATIADVMPLREENYVFVRDGLQMITDRTAPPGIVALSEAMDIVTCTSGDVAYRLAPAINAPGRIADRDVYTMPLLACSSIEKARQYAAAVKNENERRKQMTAEGAEKASAILKEEHYSGGLIMVRIPDLCQGLCGILAGKLCDMYKTPTVVVTEGDDGLLHGSARSVAGYNIAEAFARHRDKLERFGGHSQAAGITVRNDRFKEAKAAITQDYLNCGVPEEHGEDDRYYDLEIKASDIASVLNEQDLFEPYGEGNAKPVFRITDFRLVERPKETAGSGVRLKSEYASAIGFGMWPEAEVYRDRLGIYTLYGTLSWNEYRGNRNPQVELLGLERMNTENETEFVKKLRSIT